MRKSKFTESQIVVTAEDDPQKSIRLYLSLIQSLGLGGILVKIPTIHLFEVVKRAGLGNSDRWIKGDSAAL